MKRFLDMSRLLCAGILTISVTAHAAEPEDNLAELQRLDERIQTIKRKAIDLAVQQRIIDTQAFYPPQQRTRFFVTLDVFSFDLDRIELKIDGNPLITHGYTARELYGLRRGGVHEIFYGNIPPGQHTLEATFAGRFSGDSAEDPEYVNSVQVSFVKGPAPKNLELRIDKTHKRELTFRIFQRELES